MKTFLLVFDQSRITRDMVIRCIDHIDVIENWYALFDNTILIASHATSQQMSTNIRQAYPELKFIMSEVDSRHRSGWLPRSVWAFLNDPRSAATESA